ncbi:hypothetical protein QYF36_011436 [Acer negundo]|nr:hypothetical protein QYF36_011436 [Acer negundo]
MLGSSSRGMEVMVNANLNNRKVGQICVKLSSTEHMEIALIAVFSILGGLLREKATESRSSEALEISFSISSANVYVFKFIMLLLLAH